MNQIAEAVASPNLSAIDRWLRERLLSQLAPLQGGALRVHDAAGEITLGEPAEGGAVEVWIRDPSFYRLVAAKGSVGAGEAYIEGAWRCSDLVALVRLLVRNRALLDGMERGPARLGGALLRAWSAMRPNTRGGSRRNIAAHYDLGNDFFSLFLSDDRMYSSALFADADEALETASQRKLERI